MSYFISRDDRSAPSLLSCQGSGWVRSDDPRLWWYTLSGFDDDGDDDDDDDDDEEEEEE